MSVTRDRATALREVSFTRGTMRAGRSPVAAACPAVAGADTTGAVVDRGVAVVRVALRGGDAGAAAGADAAGDGSRRETAARRVDGVARSSPVVARSDGVEVWRTGSDRGAVARWADLGGVETWASLEPPPDAVGLAGSARRAGAVVVRLVWACGGGAADRVDAPELAGRLACWPPRDCSPPPERGVAVRGVG